jgi:hypothetical protein
MPLKPIDGDEIAVRDGHVKLIENRQRLPAARATLRKTVEFVQWQSVTFEPIDMTDTFFNVSEDRLPADFEQAVRRANID